MPLIQSASKKAFKKNVETEMKDNPGNRAKDLAISYETQRRNMHKRKKMAQGGNVTAANEARPMPETRADDSAMIARQEAPKALKDSTWTGRPTVTQAQRPSKTPLSRPKLVGSDAFSVRYRSEIDEDNDRMASMPPESDKAQPPKRDDEEGPDRQGSKVHPMKMMAEGGRINGKVSMSQAEEDADEHPAGLEEDDDMMSPAKDEYMAGHFAEGGSIDTEETMDEDDSDLAAAVMAKRKTPDMETGSEDEDEAVDHYDDGGSVHPSDMSLGKLADGIKDMFSSKPYNTQIYKAEGGQVDLDENSEEEPNDYYSRNRAALKENFDSDIHLVDEPDDSNEHGDSREMDEENDHDDDIVGSIRSKMKKRSPMTR